MKKNKKRIITLEQWVEVETNCGKTVTKLYPSNAELRKKSLEMDPPPDLVYRRINFGAGVPLEYHWTTKDELRRRQGGHCIQRMALATWLQIIQREELRPGQHLGACGACMPRPKERGGCDCPVCTAATRRLEAEAAAKKG
jgi:hypothetical protein